MTNLAIGTVVRCRQYRQGVASAPRKGLVVDQGTIGEDPMVRVWFYAHGAPDESTMAWAKAEEITILGGLNALSLTTLQRIARRMRGRLLLGGPGVLRDRLARHLAHAHAAR